MELENIPLKTKLQGHERTPHTRLSLLLQQEATRRFQRSGTRSKPCGLNEEVMRGDVGAVRRKMANVTRTELNKVDAKGMTALHYAAKRNHEDIALLLLDNGASIDIMTMQGNALQTAIKNRKEATAIALLLRGASITLAGADGTSALHLAVYHRLTGIVTRMLENYILDLNAQDGKMNTALHYAAINGDAVLCRALLDYGALIDVRNYAQETVLHLAAGENNKDVLDMLLTLDFKELCITKEHFINMEKDGDKTALHVAAQMGHCEVIGVLISHGADIHGVTRARESPLHLAASSGNENAVRLLLEEGISIDMMDKDERTPLHNAVSHGHGHIVEMLLSSGVQLGNKDTEGNTPLLLAIKSNNCTLAKRLLDEGADISDQDFDLKTGLHSAIENHNYALSLLLLDRFKALVHIKDEDGRTPLHYAAQLGQVKILRLIIKRTMQLDDTDNFRETALHLASRNGNVACVELLINDPKSVTICNQDGHTPLHLAVVHNQPAVCQVLLQGHADVNARDSAGWSPLFYAIYHDNLEVLKMILERSDTDVNCVDNCGNTCLITASEAGKEKAVNLLLESGADLRSANTHNANFFDLAIDLQRESVCKTILESSRWYEALTSKDKNGRHFMHKLIKKYPHLVEIILNRSISFSDHHPEDLAFTATFNFQLLDESPTSRSLLSDTVDKILKKRQPLYYAPKIMLKHRKQRLLHHPIVSILMEIKWEKLCRYFYYLRFLVFLIYSILLNIYVYNKSQNISSPSENNNQNHSLSSVYSFKHSSVSSSLETTAMIIFLVSVLQILNEAFKLLVLRHKYFRNPENYIEIALYVSGIVTVTSIGEVDKFEVAAMALCIFLAWTNLLFYLQGIPYYSIYTTMYLKVCATLIKLLVLFGIIFICFIMIFSMLKIEHGQFKTNEMRILTLFTMMNGEVGLSDWWFDSKGKTKIPFPITTYGTMFLFLIFVIMAFTNLLIGLAVGDIESIRSSAKMQTFKQKLQLIDTIQSITPNKLLKRYVNEPKYTYMVNRKTRLQRLVQYILPDTTDDDLKQLKMKQDSFNYKVMEECFGTFSKTVTGDHNSEMSGNS